MEKSQSFFARISDTLSNTFKIFLPTFGSDWFYQFIFIKEMTPLDKISLICKKQSTEKTEPHLGTYFQGWLMAHLPSEYVEHLHHSGLKPYTIKAITFGDTIHFVVGLLNEEASKQIGSLLLNPDCREIILDMSQQRQFSIVDKHIQHLSEKDLSEIFYHSGALPPAFTLYFRSATAFKSQGEYIFFPDVRLLFQSLMKKYSYVFEGTEHVDVELLEEICRQTKITGYRVSSSYYPVHNVRIPGFIGEVRFKCRGNQTLRNYVAMLLHFAEYAGVGIKTSMGMGAVSLK